LPGLFVDVDVEGIGHKLPNLPPTMEAASKLIKRFPVEPDLVVRSGYGFQCYWSFAEALSAEDATGLLGSWAVTWQKLAREDGYHIDNVWSLDRVLRLPGTFNWKGAT
jgi:putative DNA primase/helicase